EREKVRAAGAALDVLDAVELARLAAVFAPLAEELAFRREALHAAIDLVGDVNGPILGNRDAAGLIEVAIVLAELAPGSQQLARFVIDANLVAHQWRDIDMIGPIHCNTTRHRLDGKRSEKLAFGRELLHAIVLEFADKNLVLGVYRDADRRM